MGIATRMMAAAASFGLLAGCGGEGRLFPDLHVRNPIQLAEDPSPPAIREPVLPEMLVNCGGNVLVPALGMTLVLRGQTPPEKGLYLREERLNAPYRILPPGSHPSAELSPKRLNIETDKANRI